MSNAGWEGLIRLSKNCGITGRGIGILLPIIGVYLPAVIFCGFPEKPREWCVSQNKFYASFLIFEQSSIK